jgi:outer membrane protein OmpA-like peptidoglycan-associated protein
MSLNINKSYNAIPDGARQGRTCGATSSLGDAKHNLDLSQKRANAITEALSTTFAIAPGRLFAIGVGEEWPVDPDHPKAADNRRVQLINLGLVR